MKTKPIIIVIAVLFLTGLLLSLNSRNAIAPSASEGQDFYGWKMSARTPAYPNWPGDWVKGDLGKNWKEMDWVSYIIVLNGYGGKTLPAFDVVFDFYIGGSKNAIFVDLVRYFSYKIRDPYPGSGTPNDVTPANFGTWRDASFTPTVINRPFPEGTPDSQTTPPGFAFWRLIPNSAPGLANPIPAGKSVVIYFEARLSPSFVWMNGKEYLLNQAPTNAWGGDRYVGWTTPHFGSGYTSGSNPQFRLSSEGVGQKTVPIPIPPVATGEIHGTKFFDKNQNGVWDQATEPGLGGWTINLETTIEGIPFSMSTTTAEDGSYAFTGLTAATYDISEELQSGWNQTAPTPVPPGTHTVVLGEGEVVTGKDFGNVRLSKTTTLLSASEITLGNSITDTATVASIPPGVLPTPTGTVTFYVGTSSSGPWTQVGAVKTLVSGSATSDSFTPLATGTYYFKASYSGDSNYLPSESDPTTEVLVVNKATPAVNTLLSETTITLGQSITDKATVTGLGGSFPVPTGTVDFYVMKSGGSWNLFSTKTLDATGKATSDSYTPMSAGTYYFKAVYSGDSNYLGAESDPATEVLVVNKAPTTTVTLLSASEITLGDSVTDTVTVTGLGGSFQIPTGTVDFYVSQDVATWTKFSTKTLDGSGQAISDPYTPLSAGTWYFKAIYTGDSNYLGSESGATDEPLTVNKASTTTTTLLSDSEITLGDSVTDTITVTGLGGIFPMPSGTVEFYVRKDALSWTLFSTKTLDAFGQATSDPYTPTSAGTWYFKAKYLGDDNYLPSESGDTDEPLIVNKAPTTVTTLLSTSTIRLGDSITDTITISTTATGTLPDATGTWIVEASMDSTFTTGVITVDSGTVSGSLPFTVTTKSWAPPSAGTWYFRATYSGDDNYEGSLSDPTKEVLVVTSITKTVGYWKTHPEAWAVIKPTDPFPWTTGKVAGHTYMQILEREPGGDASIILAQQYIAAKLNFYAFGVPSSIAADIAAAEAYFAGTPASPFYPTAYPAGSDPQDGLIVKPRTYAINLASILEAYNKSGE